MLKLTPEQRLKLAQIYDECSELETDPREKAKLKAGGAFLRARALHQIEFRSPPVGGGLIDSPSLLDSRQTWESFLKDLMRMPKSELVRDEIKNAREVIAEKSQKHSKPV